MQVFDADQIDAALTMPRLIDALALAFCVRYQSAAAPSSHHRPSRSRCDFVAHACLDGAFGAAFLFGHQIGQCLSGQWGAAFAQYLRHIYFDGRYNRCTFVLHGRSPSHRMADGCGVCFGSTLFWLLKRRRVS